MFNRLGLISVLALTSVVLTAQEGCPSGELPTEWEGTYTSESEWWGAEYSPLIVEADGDVTVAGVLIDGTYNAATATLTWSSQEVNGHITSGNLTFLESDGVNGFDGSIMSQLGEGWGYYRGSMAPVTKWAATYETETHWWGTVYSPLVVGLDGGVTIAGEPIEFTYDADTDELVFPTQTVKGYQVKGDLIFMGEIVGERSFDGRIIPQAGDVYHYYRGTEVVVEPVTLVQ